MGLAKYLLFVFRIGYLILVSGNLFLEKKARITESRNGDFELLPKNPKNCITTIITVIKIMASANENRIAYG